MEKFIATEQKFVPKEDSLFDTQDRPNLVALITYISCRLNELKQRRRSKEISRKIFQEQHRPLIIVYKVISQVNLEEKGGK